MTYVELVSNYLRHCEERLVFKEEALRYCWHSKKQAKLIREVEEYRSLVEWLRSIVERESNTLFFDILEEVFEEHEEALRRLKEDDE